MCDCPRPLRPMTATRKSLFEPSTWPHDLAERPRPAAATADVLTKVRRDRGAELMSSLCEGRLEVAAACNDSQVQARTTPLSSPGVCPMRRTIGSVVVLTAVAASSALAQVKPAAKQAGAPGKADAVTWGAITGDWVGKSTRGTSDSVITTMTVTFTLNRRAYMKFPNRPRIRAHNLQVGGDSVVMDIGPYDS